MVARLDGFRTMFRLLRLGMLYSIVDCILLSHAEPDGISYDSVGKTCSTDNVATVVVFRTVTHTDFSVAV